MIDYSKFEDKYPSNSALEQYNGRIKNSLSRTLSWPIFILFPTEEEDHCVIESFKNEQKRIFMTKSVKFAKELIPKILKNIHAIARTRNLLNKKKHKEVRSYEFIQIKKKMKISHPLIRDSTKIIK